ncbi:MAG TPA: DUF1611 domain-containing protein [Flavitalea sp.]|nr:DUF1611 domain-containing protein [Flavitalea sp.]
MKENAILLTGGILNRGHAKTAHGLIRTSSKFNIIGVIDEVSAGADAGYVVDGIKRNIPVYPSVESFMKSSPVKAAYAIIGVAFPGGKLPAEIKEDLKLVLRSGISVVSGLHDFLSDMPEIKGLADEFGTRLIDIRKPRPKDELKFWSGEILKVTSPIIGVMGTDCALGKRTTAVMLSDAMNARGQKSFMIYTGQTGWLQGHKYGFILDSTYNDFISGELENAVVTCFQNESPDFIFIEGQSALCNPSGPCGSEYLLSAQCKGVILQHSPTRTFYNGQDHTGIRISLQREMDLIRLYGSRVIAISLNTKGITLAEARTYQQEYEKKYEIPVALPLEEGVDKLADAVAKYAEEFKVAKHN